MIFSNKHLKKNVPKVRKRVKFFDPDRLGILKKCLMVFLTGFLVIEIGLVCCMIYRFCAT